MVGRDGYDRRHWDLACMEWLGMGKEANTLGGVLEFAFASLSTSR